MSIKKPDTKSLLGFKLGSNAAFGDKVGVKGGTAEPVSVPAPTVPSSPPPVVEP